MEIKTKYNAGENVFYCPHDDKKLLKAKIKEIIAYINADGYSLQYCIELENKNIVVIYSNVEKYIFKTKEDYYKFIMDTNK